MRHLPDATKCPFCGGTEIYIGDALEVHGDEQNEGVGVVCDVHMGGCGASVWSSTEEESIQKWERRV